MWVCLCRRVTDRAIRDAVAAGARDAAAVARATGAATDCGACREAVERLVAETAGRREQEG